MRLHYITKFKSANYFLLVLGNWVFFHHLDSLSFWPSSCPFSAPRLSYSNYGYCAWSSCCGNSPSLLSILQFMCFWIFINLIWFIFNYIYLDVSCFLWTLWFFNSAGFVGDSLNRNMFVSLFCTLKRASSEVKKWRPAGADRGFTFLQYNFTIAYHRTNLLARYGR